MNLIKPTSLNRRGLLLASVLPRTALADQPHALSEGRDGRALG